MPYEYSAENHDWDLTLRAAWNLLMSGQAVGAMPDFSKKMEQEFSFYTGSMLLSFCALESFSSSIAFLMPKDSKLKNFNYDDYKKTNRFWDKIGKIFEALGYKIDASQGLFQTIKEMQNWRNNLVHSSPYEIEKTTIQDTANESRNLHKPFHSDEYTRQVNLLNAKKYYSAACSYIDLTKSISGLDPRAQCSYKVVG